MKPCFIQLYISLRLNIFFHIRLPCIKVQVFLLFMQIKHQLKLLKIMIIDS